MWRCSGNMGVTCLRIEAKMKERDGRNVEISNIHVH